jgi:hypothetical protein
MGSDYSDPIYTMSGSPVRENATAPTFVVASTRAREIAWLED